MRDESRSEVNCRHVEITHSLSYTLFLSSDYTAVQSSAIVSSMFPSNVRDRLYDQNEADANKRKKYMEPTKNKLKNFLKDGTVTGGGGKSLLPPPSSSRSVLEGNGGSGDDPKDYYVGVGNRLPGAPIADLFTDATVMFGKSTSVSLSVLCLSWW